MDERSQLLEQLRIDRDPEPSTGGGRRWIWAIASIVILGLGGALGTWRYLDAAPVVVRAAVAEPVALADQPGQSSILDASGYVVARRQATVSSKLTGRVVEVLIEEGQHVEENEIIARLDDSNARASVAQAEARHAEAGARLEAAHVDLGNAERKFARIRQEFDAKIISEHAFDLAKAELDAVRTSVAVASRAVEVADATLEVVRRELADTVVRAPFAGIVTVKAAQEGEMVSPVSAGGGFTRTGIGTIVAMDSLEVEVDVSESFINRVKPGQHVAIRLNAYPDWSIPGRVIAIIPTADRAKATVKVRIGFTEQDPRILPEMGVRVSFLTVKEWGENGERQVRDAVLVPSDAVQADGDTGVVFVIRDDSVERRAVRLGAVVESGRVVLAGLAAGTRVAIGDFSVLADGVRVRIDSPANQ